MLLQSLWGMFTLGTIRFIRNSSKNRLYRLVPLVGDIVMASFKTNSRNAALLEEFLRIRGEEYIKVRASLLILESPPLPIVRSQPRGLRIKPS